MLKFAVRPYFLQPYSFRSFFRSEKQRWPTQLQREYFLSFEDALWDLLPRFGYRKGATIALPDFYCQDVVDNIHAHGYKTVIYPIHNDLSVDIADIKLCISKELPDIFVLLDIAGISMIKPNLILPLLSKETLFISDMVHNLPKYSDEFSPLANNHLIITSLRKVSPYFGSMAIYKKNVSKEKRVLPFRYTAYAIVVWLKYLFLLRKAVRYNEPLLVIKAEKLLQKHDNHIGDELRGAMLPSFMLKFIDRIPVSYIEAIKKKQVTIYAEHLDNRQRNSLYSIPQYGGSAGKLRGFPLLIDPKKVNAVISACRSQGLFVFDHLDSLSKKSRSKLVLLPLGPHLSNFDIETIAKITQKALTLGS